MHFKTGLDNIIFTSSRDARGNESANGEPLVIFPNSVTDDSWFIRGYREAANALVERFLDDSNSGTDILAFPIFFLYIHALELALKQYLRELVNHYNRHSCNSLPRPINDVDKIISDHELMPLFEATRLLVDHDSLHGNRNYADLKKLIKDLDAFGLSTYSLRYDKNKSQISYPLLDRQKWIFLQPLKEAFEDALTFLEFSATDESFRLCENNEFKASVLKELQYIAVLLRDLKRCCADTGYNFPEKDDEPKAMKLRQAFRLETFEDEKNEQILKNILKTKKDNILTLLTRGIVFGKTYGSMVEYASYFQEWSQERRIEYLLENFQLLERALDELDRYTAYVETMIAKR